MPFLYFYAVISIWRLLNITERVTIAMQSRESKPTRASLPNRLQSNLTTVSDSVMLLMKGDGSHESEGERTDDYASCIYIG